MSESFYIPNADLPNANLSASISVGEVETDNGSRVAVALNDEDGEVHWVALSPADARRIASYLVIRADGIDGISPCTN